MARPLTYKTPEDRAVQKAQALLKAREKYAMSRGDDYRPGNLGPHNRDTKMSNISYSMFTNAKARAKKRGIPFDLELEDIVIPEVCPCLGIPLFRGVGSFSDNSPTLDKIIPELGYVRGNVWVISMRANRIKDNSTLLELKQIVEALEMRSC